MTKNMPKTFQAEKKNCIPRYPIVIARTYIRIINQKNWAQCTDLMVQNYGIFKYHDKKYDQKKWNF